MRRQLGNPGAAAAAFTTCQITFSVMPEPQTDSFRLTHRNSRPSVIATDVTHSSTADFTQSGTGTVRMCAALPSDQIGNHPMVFPLLQVIESEGSNLSPAQAAA